jgi:hypothetical protein
VDCQRQNFHIHKWVCGAQQHPGSSTTTAGSSSDAADGCNHGGSDGSSGSSGAEAGSSRSSAGSSVGLGATVSAVLELAAARAEAKVSEYCWPHEV